MYFCIVVIVFACILGVRCGNNSLERSYSNSYGKKPHPVVLGGYVATIEEFPFAIRVYISRGRILIFCTAEAIHRKLVLTAAHCVTNYGNAIVVTGEGDHEDFVNDRNIYKYARYKVIDVFIHPGFSRVHYQNDVALLKIGREMLHPGHAIIAISYEPLIRSVDAKIFGWGGTELVEKNNQLYGKQVSVSNCSLDYFTRKLKFVCLLEKGICHGDSGGGMIVNNSIVGVASFYQRNSPMVCGSSDLYYYTAMSEVKEFVKDCIDRNGSDIGRSHWHIALEFLIVHFLLK